MSRLEEKLKKTIETGRLELPVLPSVSAEVVSLTQEQDSDAKGLAQLIQSDQSLAGHVMRMANSAAFSSIGKIQTLQQAIAKLGMRQIGQMALTVSVGHSVFKSSVSTQQIIEYLWRFSLASAIWSREVARLCRANTEVAFMCGLLHQIGKPVVINALVDLAGNDDELVKEHKQLLMLIKKYHKVVGVNVAKRWNLPEAVVESITYINDYYAAPTCAQEVTIVSAANVLAKNSLDGSDVDKFSEAMLNSNVFEDLNLYEDDVEALAKKSTTVNEMLAAMTL